MPHRVQLSRRKGWRMPSNTVSVARPGPWGNPYPVGEFGDIAVEMFKATLRGEWPGLRWPEHAARADTLHGAWIQRIGGDPRVRAVEQLRGRHLACWCALDVPCHADVLLAFANPPSRAVGTALDP